MRILVLGAGALGSVIATKLTRAGIETVAVESNASHAALCRDPGVRVDLPDGSSLAAPLTVVGSVEAFSGPFDYALITLKAPVVPAVLGPLAELDLVSTYVSLGNGLIQDTIAGIVGRDRLLVGTVSWGATFVGPGHVRQTTLAPFAIGEMVPGSDTGRVDRLLEVLEHVAPAHATTRINGQIWAKLLLNSSLSGLGTVAGTDYAGVVASEHGHRLALALWSEGLQVARALGETLDEVAGIDPYAIDLSSAGDPEVAGRTLDALLESLGATKASMLQDLERGISTEVEVINGAVVRAGARVGVSTPFNERVVEIVHSCEQGASRPDLANLARFDDLLGGL